MLKTANIIFLLLISFSFYAQTIEERKEKSESDIILLKENALLVRLQSRQKTIELLEQKGLPKKAKYYKEKQETESKELARAFKNFDFCKVYFFYAHESELIQEGKLDSVTIMDENLNPVQFELDTFFIAEVGDLPKNYDLDTIQPEESKKRFKKKKSYSGGTDMGIKCLYIRDQNFNILDKPFPFYQRYHPLPLTNLTNEEVILKLNEKLKEYFEEVN